MKTIFPIIGFWVFAWAATALAGNWDLQYAGRLTEASGAPVAGPVTLRVQFYRSETGNDLVSVTLADFENVPLVDGLFQLTIALSDADRSTIFNGTQPAYVEITDTTRGVTYPRQLFGVVPFALKVPVNSKMLKYDANGQLTLLNAPETGKFVSANAQGELVWTALPGGGDMVAANNLSDLVNAAAARTNLGLGDAGTKNVGTGAGDVAAGNHTHVDSTTAVSGFMSAADKTKLDGIAAGAGVVNSSSVDAAGAVMNSDFAGNGIMTRTGAGAYSSITDNSANWNTAYTDRLKWDGAQVGAGMVADQLAGRGALGLGTIATQNANSVSITGGSISGVTGFASTGIDDNADALAMTIDANENVGIGTSAPLQKLVVEGGDIFIRPIANTSGGSIGKFGFGPSGTAFYEGKQSAYMEGLYQGAAWSSGTQLRFYTNPGPDITTATTTSRMTIDKDGNVGIGTTSPSAKLIVADASLADGQKIAGFIGNSASEFAIYNNGQIAINAGGYATYPGLINFDEGEAHVGMLAGTFPNRALALRSSGGDIQILPGSLSNAAKSLIVKPGANSTTTFQVQNAAGTAILNVDSSNSYVGIGTTNPGAKLDVAGTPGVDGIKFPDGTLQTTASAGGTYVVKNSSTSRSSTTAVTDDPDLSYALAANESINFEIGLWVTVATATPDYNFGLQGPGAPAFFIYNVQRQDCDGSSSFMGGGNGTSYGSGISYDCLASGTSFIWIRGSLKNGATAGSFRLQWAQRVSSASDTTVNAGSYMAIHKY